MKAGILIPLFLSALASAQNPHFPSLKVTGPCNQEFLDHFKGKWLIPERTLLNSPGNTYAQESMKRISEIHEMVKQIYPQPTGADALRVHNYTINDFAYTVKYVTEDDRTQKEYVKRNQVEGWHYAVNLFAWFCRDKNPREIWNGFPEAGGGTALTVYANHLVVLTGEFSDDDTWTIEGRPIKVRMPVVGQWKGYEVMAANGGANADQNNAWYILIPRNGMLPYIPVTRKQYLERAIAYVTRFYDQLIAGSARIPDKAEREESNKRDTNDKNIAVRNLQRELQKTTEKGLLSAPAVVRPDAHFQTEGPIFLSESEGGVMLTTENPNYFRKDLPGYIPQLFVLSWSWGAKKWETDFRGVIEENFPVERLKAMIDK